MTDFDYTIPNSTVQKADNYICSGEYESTLNDKWQLKMPSEFYSLGEVFRLCKSETLGREMDCLVIMSEDVFNTYYKNMKLGVINSPTTQEQELRLQVLQGFLADCQPVRLDAQFRFVVPQSKRELLNIKFDASSARAMFVGVGNTIQIWNETTYLEHKADQSERLARFRKDKLNNMGILPL